MTFKSILNNIISLLIKYFIDFIVNQSEAFI